MKSIRKLIHEAFQEDHVKHDITTQSTILDKTRVKAHILVKERGIICGLDIAKEIFNEYDSSCRVILLNHDGQMVRKGTIAAEIRGSAHTVLACERTVLNFLQRLSGIATLTRHYVDKVSGTNIRILDTRKTTAGWRKLEKYAVKCGGGENHRMNLEDMAMIKDTHIKIIGSIQKGVKSIREKHPSVKVEVECQNNVQVKDALEAGADIIMLDNMSFPDMQRAVSIIRGFEAYKPEIEISGGVNLQTIEQFKNLDVDRVSIGALTHSAPSLDISLVIVDE